MCMCVCVCAVYPGPHSWHEAATSSEFNLIRVQPHQSLLIIVLLFSNLFHLGIVTPSYLKGEEHGTNKQK